MQKKIIIYIYSTPSNNIEHPKLRSWTPCLPFFFFFFSSASPPILLLLFPFFLLSFHILFCPRTHCLIFLCLCLMCLLSFICGHCPSTYVKTLNLKQLRAKQVVYPMCEASILKVKLKVLNSGAWILLTHVCVELKFNVPSFLVFDFLFKYPLLLFILFFLNVFLEVFIQILKWILVFLFFHYII